MKDQPEEEPKMIKHDGYSSVICEHHQDIMTCPACDVFKDAIIVDRSTFWQKLKDPIGWWRVRRSIKKWSTTMRGLHAMTQTLKEIAGFFGVATIGQLLTIPLLSTKPGMEWLRFGALGFTFLGFLVAGSLCVWRKENQ